MGKQIQKGEIQKGSGRFLLVFFAQQPTTNAELSIPKEAILKMTWGGQEGKGRTT
jgi:hypothetical protein